MACLVLSVLPIVTIGFHTSVCPFVRLTFELPACHSYLKSGACVSKKTYKKLRWKYTVLLSFLQLKFINENVFYRYFTSLLSYNILIIYERIHFSFSVGGMPSLFFQPYRKPKRIRTAFSPSQLLQLEKSFEKSHYVVGQERKDLANELQLTETQVSHGNQSLHTLKTFM